MGLPQAIHPLTLHSGNRHNRYYTSRQGTVKHSCPCQFSFLHKTIACRSLYGRPFITCDIKSENSTDLHDLSVSCSVCITAHSVVDTYCTYVCIFAFSGAETRTTTAALYNEVSFSKNCTGTVHKCVLLHYTVNLCPL